MSLRPALHAVLLIGVARVVGLQPHLMRPERHVGGGEVVIGRGLNPRVGASTVLISLRLQHGVHCTRRKHNRPVGRMQALLSLIQISLGITSLSSLNSGNVPRTMAPLVFVVPCPQARTIPPQLLHLYVDQIRGLDPLNACLGAMVILARVGRWTRQCGQRSRAIVPRASSLGEDTLVAASDKGLRLSPSA